MPLAVSFLVRGSFARAAVFARALETQARALVTPPRSVPGAPPSPPVAAPVRRARATSPRAGIPRRFPSPVPAGRARDARAQTLRAPPPPLSPPIRRRRRMSGRSLLRASRVFARAAPASVFAGAARASTARAAASAAPPLERRDGEDGGPPEARFVGSWRVSRAAASRARRRRRLARSRRLREPRRVPPTRHRREIRKKPSAARAADGRYRVLVAAREIAARENRAFRRRFRRPLRLRRVLIRAELPREFGEGLFQALPLSHRRRAAAGLLQHLAFREPQLFYDRLHLALALLSSSRRWRSTRCARASDSSRSDATSAAASPLRPPRAPQRLLRLRRHRVHLRPRRERVDLSARRASRCAPPRALPRRRRRAQREPVQLDLEPGGASRASAPPPRRRRVPPRRRPRRRARVEVARRLPGGALSSRGHALARAPSAAAARASASFSRALRGVRCAVEARSASTSRSRSLTERHRLGFAFPGVRVESLPDVVRGASKRLELGARRGGLVERRVRLSPRVRGHRDGRRQLAAQAVMSLARLRRARASSSARASRRARAARRRFSISSARLAPFRARAPARFILRGGKARLVPLALGGDGELARARFRGESLARAGGALRRAASSSAASARASSCDSEARCRARSASSAAASLRPCASVRSAAQRAEQRAGPQPPRANASPPPSRRRSPRPRRAPVLSASAPSAFCKSVPSRGASPSTDAEGARFGFGFRRPRRSRRATPRPRPSPPPAPPGSPRAARARLRGGGTAFASAAAARADSASRVAPRARAVAVASSARASGEAPREAPAESRSTFATSASATVRSRAATARARARRARARRARRARRRGRWRARRPPPPHPSRRRARFSARPASRRLRFSRVQPPHALARGWCTPRPLAGRQGTRSYLARCRSRWSRWPGARRRRRGAAREDHLPPRVVDGHHETQRVVRGVRPAGDGLEREVPERASRAGELHALARDHHGGRRRVLAGLIPDPQSIERLRRGSIDSVEPVQGSQITMLGRPPRECRALSPLLRRPSLGGSSRVTAIRAPGVSARDLCSGPGTPFQYRALRLLRHSPPHKTFHHHGVFLQRSGQKGVVAFCRDKTPATSRPSAPQGDERLCRSISRAQRGDGVLPSPWRRSPRGRRVRPTMEPTRRARASRKASYGTLPKNRPARERGGGLRRRVRRPHGR